MEKVYGIGHDLKLKMVVRIVRRTINTLFLWFVTSALIMGFVFKNTDSAVIEKAVIVVVFILYAILYVNRLVANIRHLKSGLKMILTENRLTCEMDNQLVLDINLDDVTFDFDKSNLKYQTSNGESLEFPAGDLIGFNHYWDLCDTLNKMGKMKNYGFQVKK